MLSESTLLLTDVVHEAARPLVGEANDYDPLMKLIGEAPLVLIGEALHGTHEFYRERAQITKHHRTITAPSNWDAPAERKQVKLALGTYEALFHEVNTPGFLLTFGKTDQATTALNGPLLELAIDLIYRAETERASHYFQARLSAQFDAVLHFDEIRAVEPLERTAEWETGEVPETFPTGI